MMWAPIVAAVVVVVVCGLLVYGYLRATTLPANRPAAFLRRGRREAERVVVCAGDSITHGAVSSDYVKLLEDRFAGKGYAFVNAGVNGELAYNLLQRIDDIVACQPDYVTVLIGTNDVNATLTQRLEVGYIRTHKLPGRPTMEVYRESLHAIVRRLKAETTARIALLSLPLLGEDVASTANQRADTYSDVIREVALAEGVTYLPLRERQAPLVKAQAHPPRSYEGNGYGVMLSAILQRTVLKRDWNDISASNRMMLLTDYLHLNDTAAVMVADLISAFLDGDGAGF